jgi:hypothetical protein
MLQRKKILNEFRKDMKVNQMQKKMRGNNEKCGDGKTQKTMDRTQIQSKKREKIKE